METRHEPTILEPAPSPLGTVLGGLALFIAVQGMAFALPGLNSVDSGDIVNGQVRGPDLGPIVRVNGPPLSIAAGLSGTAMAICPGGSRIVSVGFQRSANGLPIGNVDTLGPHQARVTGYNSTGAPVSLQARAFCLAL